MDNIMQAHQFLNYGAIGLSCILSILTYILLRKEQDKKAPRMQIITAIYIFMVVTLISSSIGYIAEANKNTNDIDRVKDKCRALKRSVEALLATKNGNITAIESIKTKDEAGKTITKIISHNLADIDKEIKEILEDLEMSTDKNKK